MADPTPIARDAYITVAHKAAVLLRGRIADGTYPPDAQIPPEPELCREFGIARLTLRAAVDELEAQHLLRRVQGKGTFVVPPTERHPLRDAVSITGRIRHLGLRPHAEIVEARERRAPPDIACALKLGRGASAYYLRRVHYGDEQPLGVSRTWINPGACPDILEERAALRGSVYELMTARYGLYWEQARQSIAALAVPASLAGELAVPPGHPALVLTGVTYTLGGTPIEALSHVLRGDVFRLRLDQGQGEHEGERLELAEALFEP